MIHGVEYCADAILKNMIYIMFLLRVLRMPIIQGRAPRYRMLQRTVLGVLG